MREETGEAVGINLVSNYEVFPQQKEEPFWKDIVFGFRQVTGPELQLSPTSAGGWFYTTFIVEGNKVRQALAFVWWPIQQIYP